jgi:peptidoglycan L-alanyl-D-glutamate endopeptidase CwlK
MRGPDVGKWQDFLVRQKLLEPPVDGEFGPNTDAATRAFQNAKGITVDGIVGEKTFQAAGLSGFRTIRRITGTEVTPAITAAAKRIISEHFRDPFGTEVEFDADGKQYVARIEEHYHEPGGPIKPWGHHPGVSVFAVVKAEEPHKLHDADAVPDTGAPEFGGVANVTSPNTNKFSLSERSITSLLGVHEDLVKIVKRAIEVTTIDFVVLEGKRTLERQRQLLAQGRTQTLNSRHLTGHAVDLAPLEGATVVWDWPAYHKLAEYVKAAANDVKVPVEWGGDWKSFPDGPHWQLPVSRYP